MDLLVSIVYLLGRAKLKSRTFFSSLLLQCATVWASSLLFSISASTVTVGEFATAIWFTDPPGDQAGFGIFLNFSNDSDINPDPSDAIFPTKGQTHGVVSRLVINTG
jgi:hypothetical protein